MRKTKTILCSKVALPLFGQEEVGRMPTEPLVKAISYQCSFKKIKTSIQYNGYQIISHLERHSPVDWIRIKKLPGLLSSLCDI